MDSLGHKLKKSGQGMKQDKVIKMFCLFLLHLVGLHDTTILGPDSFKGGLDVVVPLDNLMIIRYREILLYYNSQTFCSCILIKKKKDLIPLLQSSTRIVRKPSSKAWNAVEAGR